MRSFQGLGGGSRSCLPLANSKVQHQNKKRVGYSTLLRQALASNVSSLTAHHYKGKNQTTAANIAIKKKKKPYSICILSFWKSPQPVITFLKKDGLRIHAARFWRL